MNIITMIKAKGIKPAIHVARRGQMRKAYKILVRNPEWNRKLRELSSG
jgi:hypothetical protein